MNERQGKPTEQVGDQGPVFLDLQPGRTGPDTQVAEDDPLTTALVAILEDVKLVKRVKDLWALGLTRRDPWDRRAERAREIMRNKLWRSEHEAQVRVRLNRLRGIILNMKAQITETEPTVRVRPVGGGDEGVAEVLNGAMRWSLERGPDQSHIDRAIDDVLETGLGVLVEHWDPNLNNGKGDLRAYRVDPRHIVVDDETRSDQWEDASYIIRAERRRMDDAEMAFPSLAGKFTPEKPNASLFPRRQDDTTISKGDDDYYNQQRSSTSAGSLSGEAATEGPYREEFVVQKEFWYKRIVKHKVRFITDTAVALLLGLDDSLEEAGIYPLPADVSVPSHARDVQVHVIDWTTVEWWLATVIGEHLVQHIKSPYPDGHPFVFITARMNDDSPYPTGEVEYLEGWQDLWGLVWSIILENAIVTKNSGGYYERGSLTPEQTEGLRQLGAKPGVWQEVATGALSGNKMREVKPSPLPRALYDFAREMRNEPDSIAVQYEVQRGDSPFATSGKGLLALQSTARRGELLRQRMISRGLSILGMKRVHNMQAFFTEERLMRILAPNGDTEFAVVNQPIIDKMTGDVTKAKDLQASEFDVVIVIDAARDMSRREQVQQVTYLHDRKIVDDEYLLKALELPGWQDILARKRSRDAMEAMLANPQLSMLLNLLWNDKDALKTMLGYAATKGLVDQTGNPTQEQQMAEPVPQRGPQRPGRGMGLVLGAPKGGAVAQGMV